MIRKILRKVIMFEAVVLGLALFIPAWLLGLIVSLAEYSFFRGYTFVPNILAADYTEKVQKELLKQGAKDA